MSRKFKIVSLFSGCGGSDLGLLGGFSFLKKRYKELPTEVASAVDIDRKAVQTYNFNFKHHADVGCVKDFPTEKYNNIDIVVGGFPCQSFSTVNPSKDPFDERGQWYKEMGSVVKELKPKFFIAENVRGMMVLKKGTIFARILQEFEQHGYVLSHKLLNAADFGVPQKRQRVFIIGVRNDLGFKFEFPREPFSENPQQGQNPWEPLKKVIDSLIPSDEKYYFSRRAVEGMKKAKNNMKRGLWQDLNKPCLTVTSHLAKVSLNSRDPVLLVDEEKELYRRFTPREAARIQSFPDDFEFIGSDADAYRQIGNAIPPVLMWHVAKSLIDQLKQCKL